MRIFILGLLVALSAEAFAYEVEPQEDAFTRSQLLALPVVQEQIAWVKKQKFDAATFDDYRITSRANALPGDLDPLVFANSSHYFMFLSSDWKYICQISLRALWKKAGADIKLESAELESESVCYPRL